MPKRNFEMHLMIARLYTFGVRYTMIDIILLDLGIIHKYIFYSINK